MGSFLFFSRGGCCFVVLKTFILFMRILFFFLRLKDANNNLGVDARVVLTNNTFLDKAILNNETLLFEFVFFFCCPEVKQGKTMKSSCQLTISCFQQERLLDPWDLFGNRQKETWLKSKKINFHFFLLEKINFLLFFLLQKFRKLQVKFSRRENLHKEKFEFFCLFLQDFSTKFF